MEETQESIEYQRVSKLVQQLNEMDTIYDYR